MSGRPGSLSNLKSGRKWILPMNARKAALEVVGVILLLMGIVFSLQGMNVITGSSVMSGVGAYIYIGAVVAIVGLVILYMGLRTGRAPAAPQKTEAPQPVAN